MCSRPVTSSGPTPNTTPSPSTFGATTQLSPRTSALSTPAHIAQYVEDLVSPSLDRYGSGATVGRLSPRVQASHNVEDLALTSHASAHHLLGCRPSTPMHGEPSWQFADWGRRLPVSETKCNRDHIGLGVFLHDANEYTHSTLHSGCMV